jgi:hypothetical protein
MDGAPGFFDSIFFSSFVRFHSVTLEWCSDFCLAQSASHATDATSPFAAVAHAFHIAGVQSTHRHDLVFNAAFGSPVSPLEKKRFDPHFSRSLSMYRGMFMYVLK